MVRRIVANRQGAVELIDRLMEVGGADTRIGLRGQYRGMAHGALHLHGAHVQMHELGGEAVPQALERPSLQTRAPTESLEFASWISRIHVTLDWNILVIVPLDIA